MTNLLKNDRTPGTACTAIPSQFPALSADIGTPDDGSAAPGWFFGREVSLGLERVATPPMQPNRYQSGGNSSEEANRSIVFISKWSHNEAQGRAPWGNSRREGTVFIVRGGERGRIGFASQSKSHSGSALYPKRRTRRGHSDQPRVLGR